MTSASKYTVVSTDIYEKEINEAELQKLKDWLAENRLKKYTDVFIQNEVYELNEMAMLTSTDLVEMGIKAVGARRKLLNQIMELKGELVGESAAAPDSTHPSQERLPPISPSRGVHKQVQGVEAAHQDASDNRPVPDQVVAPPKVPCIAI